MCNNNHPPSSSSPLPPPTVPLPSLPACLPLPRRPLPPLSPPGSLPQTPQLPGAAPARPEVTRLLPTTRLRLALPLSISLLPPSFARSLRSRCFSQSLSICVSLSLSFSPAHHHPPPTLAHPSTTVIYMRTHSVGEGGGFSRVSPFPLPPSLPPSPSGASLFRSFSLPVSVCRRG